jgi:hypothetical protein
VPVLAGDSLIDTNGTTLPAHVPTGPDAGDSWQRGPFAAQDMVIQANGIVPGVAGFVDIHAVFNKLGDPWPADVSVAFDMHFFTNLNNMFPAVTLRHATGNDQCYGCQYDSTTGWGIEIWSTSNPGGPTELASAAYIYPGDGIVDAMIFEVEGNALRLWKNGVLFISTTDNTITVGGKPGVYGTCGTLPTATTGFHIENIVASDFGEEIVITRSRKLATQQRMVA